MREFPVTVSSHVYHINSSASNLFDDDQYQRKLPAIESDINCFHQKPTTAQQQQQQQQHQQPQQQQQTCSNNNKNAANYICTSNGDLTSLQSGRLQNFTNINNIHNNNCNRSHKIAVKSGSFHSGGNDKNVELRGETSDGNRMTSAGNTSYSIFDAITNAVTTGHCASTVYPTTNNRNDADFDQINLGPDPLTTSTSIHNLKNASSHMNNDCGQFQHYHFNNTRTHQFPSANYKHSYLLWIGTPVAASFAVAIVIASLAGPQWLLTEEKIRNPNFNGTINYNNAIDDGMYILKTTKSSLWILCFAQGVEYQCSKIDYFPKDEYSPDPNDSTMAIPFVSYLILMVAMCSQRHSVLFFFSGIFFIIAGLIMLIGIIMYISLFKSEIGSKLRPRSMFQTPLFTYRYGHSFILFIVGCISAEIVGTLNFFLFIQIREIGREKAIPCFMYASTAKDEPDEKRINPIGQEFKAPPPFKCHKHPTIPKAFFSPHTQRRYFFEKPVPKCDATQKNLAKSLNELYTEPAPGTLFPYDLPHEFPLTRSVSTTTDIFSNCSGGFNSANTNSHNPLRMYTPQLNKRSMNRQQLQEYAMQNRDYKSISRDGSHDSLNDTGGMAVNKGILTNREKSKDELFMEFCRKAGQRPKPKDIYYIDTTYDGAAEKDVFIVENYATIRKNRRNSNLSGTNQKVTNVYNSNQSLKDLNNCNGGGGGGGVKNSYPNNLFDTNSFGGSTERAAVLLNGSRDNYFSNSRINSRDSNLYASRTLPRDFLKRNIDYDVDEFSNRRISASGLYTPYNMSMTLPLTETATISAPKEFTDPTTDYYKKSYDTLASRNSRQRDAYTGSEDTLSVQWPNAIPGSPASFSNRFNYGPSFSPNTQRKPVQMSTFYSQHFPRQAKQQTPVNKVAFFQHERTSSGVNTQSRYNDNGEYESGTQTGNENGNGSSSGGSDECTTFDLDRMERERRKSHASLFEIEVDFTNGTPV
ncbi:uncharacterized protein LOC129570024 isoform X2 [Sitodiplosis mosellana]|uniref:uncharacterized protein LOC129570024 isoform X2 n=1 Tax=Sitodiplosis mosellana TaxID=263140 RepID=UPI00244519FF|nr:uncharacterized protein LOC129570024 isoform X2 [Sitodiplosis mosellana]